MAAKSRKSAGDPPQRSIEDAFTLGPLVMCRLRGKVNTDTEVCKAEFIRSPADENEVHTGLEIDGVAELQQLYVRLGDFLAKMQSGEVH